MAKRVLRYIAVTSILGQRFALSEENVGLEAFADADWSGSQATSQSTTSFIVMENRTPVNWKSTRQIIVALSSEESEYIYSYTEGKEICSIRRICAGIRQVKRLPIL